MLKQLSATNVNSRTALLSLGVFVLLTAGVIVLVIKLTTGTPAGASTPEIARAADPSRSRPSAPPADQAAGGTRDYAVIPQRNLFQPSEVRTAAPAAPPSAPPQVSKPVPAPDAPFPYRPPFSRGVSRPPLACTGIVEIGGDQYALLEHTGLGLSQYTRVGGVAFDCAVLDISDRAAMLDFEGDLFTLRIGDYKVEQATTSPDAASASSTAAAENTPPARSGNAGAMMPPAARDNNSNRQPRAPMNGQSQRRMIPR